MLNNTSKGNSKNFDNTSNNNDSINKEKSVISSMEKNQIEKQNKNVFEISKINTTSSKTTTTSTTTTTTIQLKKTENTIKDSIKVIILFMTKNLIII